jgi:hypothetical protein
VSAAKHTPSYLSNEQVQALNEKHGWFQFRDAQSDVSRAFAQDAIEMHERMRAAAPELLDVLVAICAQSERVRGPDNPRHPEPQALYERAKAAIAQATGAAT